jgi:hypothetical protein
MEGAKVTPVHIQRNGSAAEGGVVGIVGRTLGTLTCGDRDVQAYSVSGKGKTPETPVSPFLSIVEGQKLPLYDLLL